VLVYREKGSADGLYAASGLIRDDHTLKPSYFTYRTLARLLSSASSIEELTHTDENVRLYAVRAPTGVTLAAWSVRPTAKPVLGLDLGMVTVTDAFGGSLGRLPSRDLGLSDFVVYLSEFENQKALAALLEREQALRSARRDRERREAKLEVRLFDFGSKKLDGWLFLGRLRYFTPVVASDRWSEQKGHGFVTGPGADEDRHWIGNPLTRDRVRFEPGHEFRFRTKPGRHAVTIGAEQRGPAPKLTLRSGSFTHSLELPHGARTATVELDLPPDVASQGLTLSTDETIALEWLSVVEVVR
jgi:hypothetical protein